MKLDSHHGRNIVGRAWGVEAREDLWLGRPRAVWARRVGAAERGRGKRGGQGDQQQSVHAPPSDTAVCRLREIVTRSSFEDQQRWRTVPAGAGRRESELTSGYQASGGAAENKTDRARTSGGTGQAVMMNGMLSWWVVALLVGISCPLWLRALVDRWDREARQRTRRLLADKVTGDHPPESP